MELVFNAIEIFNIQCILKMIDTMSNGVSKNIFLFNFEKEKFLKIIFFFLFEKSLDDLGKEYLRQIPCLTK